MRFAIHRPGIPEASPRSHGVPRRDVPGRVHISVAGVSAGSAYEAHLALTRVRIHVPARRAALAGVGGSDPLHPAGRLFLQPAHQQAPARPHDLAVEAGLGPHVLTGVPCRPPGRPGHVANLQVLDSDQVEPAGNVRAGFLRPVLAPVCLAGLQPGDHLLDLAAAVRPATGPGQLALQASHSPPPRLGQARDVQELARRQGRGHRDASVDAHALAVTGCWDRLGDHGEGEVPAPGPVHPHSGLDSDDPASFVASGFAPGRSPGRVARVEERGSRLGEVPQRLLLDHLRTRGQPWVLGASGGELSALLQVAGNTLAAWVPVRMLFDGQIPYVPGMAAVLPQHGLLGGRGVQPVPRYANTLSTTADISGEVKRRFLPGLKAGASTAPSR